MLAMDVCVCVCVSCFGLYRETTPCVRHYSNCLDGVLCVHCLLSLYLCGTVSPGIYGGFLGQLIALLVVPTSYFFHFDENTNYLIIMGATAFAAVVTAFIDSCAISFAAQYPESIQAGLQLGIGVSTLIGSIYRLLTKAIFPESMLVQSSLLYFYCGAATIVLCVFAYKSLLSLSISKRVIQFGLSPRAEENRRIRMSTETTSLTAGSSQKHAYQSIEEGNKVQQQATDYGTKSGEEAAEPLSVVCFNYIISCTSGY